MPYTAYNPSSDDIDFAAEAKPQIQYQCINCNKPVSFVRGHTRELPDGSNTTVREHFRYGNCVHGTVNKVRDGTGSGGNGGGGGESDIHIRRKRAALQEAKNRYPDGDYGTEVPIGEKRADALLEFDEPHEKYGKGLVIEYQHKNEGKDIQANEQYFAKREYTVVWLWEDQYSFKTSIPEIDLFGGKVYTPWPDAVPEIEQWAGEGLAMELHSKWANAVQNGLTNSVVEANILKDWVVPTKSEYWESKSWDARFRSKNKPSTQDHILQGIVAGPPPSVKVPAHISISWSSRYHWKETAWSDRFSGYEHRPKRENVKAELEIDVAYMLDREFWRKCWSKGRASIHENTDVEPPKTVFDDVQCHECGNYTYAPNADKQCPNCGEKYSWRWNITTGRISRESVPDAIEI